MQETIGTRIRRLRQDKKWSQQDLAQRLGVSRVAVNKYETGNSSPSRRLRDLAALLDTSVEYLVTGKNSPSNLLNSDTGEYVQLTHQDRQILTKLRALDDRGRITVLDLLERELALSHAYNP